jgi:hypothetical protein
MEHENAGRRYSLAYRDPYNYWRDLLDAGEYEVSWTAPDVMSKRIDTQRFMRTNFAGTPWRQLHISDWCAWDQDYTCARDEVIGVYPVFNIDKHPLSDLKDYLENPWGDRAVQSDLDWFERPVHGQINRVVIKSLRAGDAFEQRKVRKLRDIQLAYPEVEFFIHYSNNYNILFGSSFGGGDFNPRFASIGNRITLPGGRSVKDYDYPEVKALGFDPSDFVGSITERTLFNITSARYAAHHWENPTGLSKRRPRLREVDHSSPTMFAHAPNSSIKTAFPAELVKPTDKIVCDHCSLWRMCTSYRKASVCNMAGTESKKLSDMALSRDAGVITDMLASIVSKQAERAERALTDEQFSAKTDGLDPQVDKMLNSLFKNGVQLAKLRDPTLGKPLVQINNNTLNAGGAAASVGGADPRALVASVVAQIEAKGIDRSEITQEMVELAMQEHVESTPDVQDAEIVQEY